MKLPKLILSDLDGTLVPEGEGSLPEKLVQVIDRLQRAGIPFAVASGRQYASLSRVFASLEQPPLIAALNGGCIFREGKCLFADPMPQEAALEIARQTEKWPGCEVILETAEECWVYRSKGAMAAQLKRRKYHFAEIDDLSQLTGQVIKVACYLPQGGVEDLMAWGQAQWSSQVTVVRSGACWVDFNVADKGKGLRAACGLLGISAEEVLAFGDNLNDAPMLSAAGAGYAAPGSLLAARGDFPVCPDILAELEKICDDAEKNACNP
ncbi:MAG: HAD family phosphatase [Oscillospiraceae bacterium]|nr:HAD family phosphatase [Oscillospiraceae bacterium]